MKGGLVDVRRTQIEGTHAVQKRMRGFVRHNVVRKTREGRLSTLPGEIAEGETLGFASVVGVGVGKGVWSDLEVMRRSGAAGRRKAPGDGAAESRLKVGQHAHCGGIDILLVEVGVAYEFLNIPHILVTIRIEVLWPRFVVDVASSVEIDDVDAVALWTGLEALGRHRNRGGKCSTPRPKDGWILREHRPGTRRDVLRNGIKGRALRAAKCFHGSPTPGAEYGNAEGGGRVEP